MAKPHKIDLKAAVDESSARRRGGAIDKWLAMDPMRATEFWEHVDYGHERGLSYREIVAIWNANRDPLPVKFEQIRIQHAARRA